jgi:hypothetical protein
VASRRHGVYVCAGRMNIACFTRAMLEDWLAEL